MPLLLLCFVVPALLSIPISSHVPRTSAAVLFAFVTYWSALTSFTLAYRLSPFHPLAKYPGPTVAKASKLWGSYHSTTGNVHRYYKSLHERFGDVVRIGKYHRRMVPPLRVKTYVRLLTQLYRSKRALNSRFFSDTPCPWERRPIQRSTCVYGISNVVHLKPIVIRLE